MIRWCNYSIKSNETGESRDVAAEARFPLKVKDAVIGGGLAVGGIAYMLVKAFKFGAERFDKGETKAMLDLGIIKSDGSEQHNETLIPNGSKEN